MLLFRLVYYCHVLLLLLAPKTINQSVQNAFYYYYDYCVLQSILKSSQVTQIQSHVHASCCCSIMFALYIFSFFLFFSSFQTWLILSKISFYIDFVECTHKQHSLAYRIGKNKAKKMAATKCPHCDSVI